MMGQRALQIKVGLLVVVAAVVLGGFIFILGNYSFGEGFTVQVDFDFVGNLPPGAPVKVAGIKVGRVERISFLGGRVDERTKRRVYVRLHLWLESRARATVRTNSRIYINTQGILGEQYIEIEPGNPDVEGSREWTPDLPPLAGENPPRTDLVIARLYTFLDEITTLLTTEKPTLSKGLHEAVSMLESMNKLLTENHDTIGKVLTESDGLLVELTTTAKSANAALGDGKVLVQTLQSAQYLVNVLSGRLPKLIDSVEKTLVEAQNLTRLMGPKERDRIFSSLDKLDRLSGQLELVATDSRGMLKKINAGEGTAGALLMKREVYEDLKELVRDLRENPWKLFWKD
ncbi:MAG: hypothetical protein CVU65_00775 [Deltaproteobacteria bacterium HGW-Deltaproteobacteria-22]|nr:MAG: hypothetical protein CVU65_00775 [Deltaproteobacteria bacterium HGW-Deltaproteobacteria-22]